MKTSVLIRPAVCTLALALLASTALATEKRKAPSKKPAEAAPAALSEEQLSNADRVFTGTASCDAGQSVHVNAVPEHKGYFKLEFKGKSYLMAPEVTQTGAVRLEDKKNGLVWLQIPAKSMLMNAKVGQRMVDNCMSQAQKS